MNLEKVVANLSEKVERRFYGKYRGRVVDNADPKKMGRLQANVPSVLGPDEVTGWAMPCVPYGGDMNQGFLFIPKVGAGVWVEFEEGDLEFPIWAGTFWSLPDGESELPKTNAADGAEEEIQDPPTRKIIKTVAGHTLQFEDAEGDEMILLYEGEHNHVVVMNKDGIKVIDGANRHEIVLDSSGITITDGVNAGNTVTLSGTGMALEDKNGNGIIMGAGGIQMGSSSAAELFVLGTQFKTEVTNFILSLSTHTHVGNMGAPTSPPTSPIKLDVPLSSKHKVE